MIAVLERGGSTRERAEEVSSVEGEGFRLHAGETGGESRTVVLGPGAEALARTLHDPCAAAASGP